jgi:para-nitrobenzyl esterase
MTAYGAICPQPPSPTRERSTASQRMDEDCLYLNVWTPVNDAADRLPVMVWIHGGGLTNGSGSEAYYDGETLARHGVVVVTVNYRLGPFGFFAHPQLSAESPDGVSGNYGLLDQIAALRWVRDNIAHFGGDPARVTIFGESAGGVSVCTLMCSPLATGLFHRAICQSGAPAKGLRRLKTAQPNLPSAEEHGKTLTTQLGIADTPGALAALRQLPWQKILTLAKPIGVIPGSGMRDLLCVDGYLLHDEPDALFTAGKQARVPFMVGSTADEGTLFAQKASLRSEAAYRTFVLNVLGEGGQAVLRQYPVRDNDPTAALARVIGDSSFTATARRTARRHAAMQPHTYRYEFRRSTRLLQRMGLRAFHGSEIPYVFGNVTALMYGAADRTLAETVMGYWTRFAATGEVNGGNAPRWEPYDPERDNLLVLDDPIATAEWVKKAECDFWDTFSAR